MFHFYSLFPAEHMNLKVGNRINGIVQGLSGCRQNMKVNRNFSGDYWSQEGFCPIKVQLGASTMMMVHGPLGDVETQLTTLLPRITKLHVDEDSIIMNVRQLQYVVSFFQGSDVELILQRDDQVVTYTVRP